MELKNVTRETKIADCDNLGPSAKSLCRYCSIETVGQLLDTPIEEVRGLNYGAQTIKNLKRFVDDVKDVIDNKEKGNGDLPDIQTRFMLGKTFVKVLGCVDTLTERVEMYETEVWCNTDHIVAVTQKDFYGVEYLFFTSATDRSTCKFIIKVINK